MSINTVTIMGRVTRDPELKSAGDTGTHVCRINVAVDDRFKRDKTHFFEVTAWRQTAEFLSRYFHKGDMIAVTGSLSQDAWTAQDGSKKTKTYILADNVSFCGSKASQPAAEVPERPAPAPKPAPVREEEFRRVEEDDDLPFD